MGLKKYWPLAVPFWIVLILDMITKEYIMNHFPLYHSQVVIPGFFNLVHIQNKGVAFGILGGSAPAWRDVLLILLPIVSLAGILIFTFYFSQQKIGILLALGSVLGGALGNLIDRFRFRAVVDFLDFYWRNYHWPAFNVADTAISIGVFFLILSLMKKA